MNLIEIKAALAQGQLVFWGNSSYEVKRDSLDQFLIVHRDSTIGLFGSSGKLNGKEEDFYPVTLLH